MGSWEFCVPLFRLFPVVSPSYAKVRGLSTFCNKLPTNQHFSFPFCASISSLVHVQQYSSHQNEANGLQRTGWKESCTPSLQCFQYCEILVRTVVALNYKPFQSVEVFLWLHFRQFRRILLIQTAQSGHGHQFTPKSSTSMGCRDFCLSTSRIDVFVNITEEQYLTSSLMFL